MIEPSSVLKAPTKPRVRLNDRAPLSRQPWVHLDDPISAACRAVVQRRSSSTLEKFMGKTLRVATLKGKFLKKILSHLAKILRARGRKIQGAQQTLQERGVQTSISAKLLGLTFQRHYKAADPFSIFNLRFTDPSSWIYNY
jgi:hypothetical protein